MGEVAMDGRLAVKSDMSMEHTMVAKLPTFQLTVDQYDQMIEMGILTKNHRVELIRGEIVPKMPSNPPHAGIIKRLLRIFGALVQNQALLSSQTAVRLQDSEPEPDVSVLRLSSDDYFTRHPDPSDVYLLIEVSDSSLDRDLDLKAPLYAENGIPEYWIIDLNSDTVLVHRNPQPDGTWATVTTHTRGDTLTIAALPNVTVAVADILP
jgi:Uma2 family endonuclease